MGMFSRGYRILDKPCSVYKLFLPRFLLMCYLSMFSLPGLAMRTKRVRITFILLAAVF